MTFQIAMSNYFNSQFSVSFGFAVVEFTTYTAYALHFSLANSTLDTIMGTHGYIVMVGIFNGLHDNWTHKKYHFNWNFWIVKTEKNVNSIGIGSIKLKKPVIYHLHVNCFIVNFLQISVVWPLCCHCYL